MKHRRDTRLIWFCWFIMTPPRDPAALVSGNARVYGAWLASGLWPSTRERLPIASLAPVRRVALAVVENIERRSESSLRRWFHSGGSRLLNDAPDNAIVFDPTVYHDTHYKFHLSRKDIVHLVRSCLFSRHGDQHLLPYQPGMTSRNLSQWGLLRSVETLRKCVSFVVPIDRASIARKLVSLGLVKRRQIYYRTRAEAYSRFLPRFGFGCQATSIGHIPWSQPKKETLKISHILRMRIATLRCIRP